MSYFGAFTFFLLALVSCKSSGPKVAGESSGLRDQEASVTPPAQPYAEIQLDPDCQMALPSDVMGTDGVAPTYNSLTAVKKQQLLYKLHADSFALAGGTIAKAVKSPDFSPKLALLSGGDDNNPLKASYGFIRDPDGAKLLLPTFKRSCDVITGDAAKIPKRVHALGSVAMVSIQIDTDSEDFTGLFRGHHSVPAIMRFSISNPVRTKYTPSSGLFDTLAGAFVTLEFIPGIAIKFLFDGRPSEDLVAMESLAGQGTVHNYFLKDFSNNFSARSPNTADPAVAARYSSNSINKSTMVGVQERFEQSLEKVGKGGAGAFNRRVKNLAATNPDGTQLAAGDIRAPEELVFVPNRDFLTNHPAASENRREDFRVKLGTLNEGDIIYFLKGKKADGTVIDLGKVVLQSTPTPSYFGDRELFFRHHI